MIAARRLTLALNFVALLFPVAFPVVVRSQAPAPAPATQAVPPTPAQPVPPIPAQPSADELRATDLLRQASVLEQQRSWDDALKKLDEAKALNPHQAYLWSSYAYIDLTRDDNAAQAILNLTREMTEHPDEQNIYIVLSRTQAKQHKLSDAAATLQKLVALDPANQSALGLLANALIEDKQYPAAEKTIRDILAANPDNIEAQSFLGTALAREGKKAEALAILTPIATKSSDVGAMNNAAYVLADENLDPVLAEQTARRALAMLQQSFVGFGGSALFRTEVLVNLWDTLGWSLFRQGKIAEAEPWIRPAWTNSVAVEPGYHLGMILEKQNQPAKAMAVYEIAAFGEPGGTPQDVADNITERQQALRKAGIPSQIPDGKAALKAMLTFKVPGANTLTGVATVEFELSTQGAAHAMIVKDNVTQDSLTAVEMSLYPIDYKVGIPAAAGAVLTRRGVLTCHAATPCEFVLLSTIAALADYNLTAPAAAPVRYAAAPGSRSTAPKGDPYYNTPSSGGNRAPVQSRHSKN
jgi:tetratricopeptide (TPR) repeat protein